jgi:DNA-binding NtrC family response regulator
MKNENIRLTTMPRAEKHATVACRPGGERDVLMLRPAEEHLALVPALSSAGWTVHIARDLEEAKACLGRHGIQVGLLPIDEPARQRQELLELWEAGEHVEWVAMLEAARLQSQEISRLITAYCYDYHTLPVDLERLLFTLGHAYGMAHMNRIRDEHHELRFGPYEIIGTSTAALALKSAVRGAAQTDDPVLIIGEPGSGKTLAARAIHELSRRGQGPFVTVDCRTLGNPQQVREFFGYEKGSFPGAQARRVGQLEAASGGTLFLKEIGELPHELQARLLGCLQSQCLDAGEGTARIPLNVRVIASSSVDLTAAQASPGRLRDDLYHYLNVLPLSVPPLRARGAADVEQLASFFFERFARESRRKPRGFSQAAWQALQDYDWPGNVRELINRIRRAVIMAEKRLIRPQDLGLNETARRRRLLTLDEAREAAEREAILSCLQRVRHNVSRAARELGISRVTLYRLLEKHGMVPQRPAALRDSHPGRAR